MIPNNIKISNEISKLPHIIYNIFLLPQKVLNGTLNISSTGLPTI